MQAPNPSNETNDARQFRAGIYVRVSSARQGREGASLATQEAACRSFCQEKGWLILEAHVYRETHKRWLLHERPEMSKLREAARNGGFDVVVCYCVDRLSSQDAHVYILDEEFSRAGVAMAFATEDFEQTAIGRFVRSAKVLAAAIEVEKIRERTVRGRIARVQSGKLIPGGKPLYGYRWPDERNHKGQLIRGRLIEDPETAPVVQRIFRSLANGMTLRAIAKSLTEEGIPTPTRTSLGWQTSSIARMAHMPAYKGKAYGWGIRKGGTQPQHFDPDKAIELPDGTIPPLVDEPTWDAVQGVLTRNKQRAIRSAKNPESALLRGGYVKCGYCGSSMYPRPRSNGRIDYVCTSTKSISRTCPGPTIVSHALDRAVWQKAEMILTDPGTVKRELERLRNSDPTQHDLAAVDEAIQLFAKREAVLVQSIAMVAEPEAAAPLVTHLDELARQTRALKLERTLVLERQRTWQAQQANVAALEDWCSSVSTRLDSFGFKERRMVLDALGFSATLFGKDHEPRFVITADLDPQLVSSTT